MLFCPKNKRKIFTAIVQRLSTTPEDRKTKSLSLQTSTLNLHLSQNLEEEASQFFKIFQENTGRTGPVNFQEVCTQDLATVEDNAQKVVFPYKIDFAHRTMTGEIAKRSNVGNTINVRLIRFNNLVCWDSSLKVLFKSYRCPSCDQFSIKTVNLERHLTTFRV